MLNLIFGTAHLFRAVQPRDSAALLSSAYDLGFRYFDTAPSYGYGDCEPAVGALRARTDPAHDQLVVSTKVGIEPTARPGRAVRTAKWTARRLPTQLQQRFRPEIAAGTGRFEPRDVAQSIERSLHRLGRIDRLLLHEITPAELSDELLSCLNRYRERDDIGQLGVATANAITSDCLDRAGPAFQVAQFAAGPQADPVSLPDFVTVKVGHGLLGPAGADLQRLSAILRSDRQLAQLWAESTAGTRWQGQGGLAELLLARAVNLELTDVIVATSRPQRLAPMLALFDTDIAIEASILDGLAQLLESARSADCDIAK